MKIIQIILIAVFLAVAMISCDDNNDRLSSSLGFSQINSSVDSTFIMNDVKLQKTNNSALEKRLKNNIAQIEVQLQTMSTLMVQEDSLSQRARETSELLRKDLVRLKKDLENHLLAMKEDNVSTNNTSRDYSIEKIEDELLQIQEEIDEWIEFNIEQP